MATIDANFVNIEQRIIKCIDLAEESIVVVVAWFKNDNIFSALSRALHRGINVHIVMNQDEINFGQNGLNFQLLQKSGASVYLIGQDMQRLVHHKYCIIDNNVIITGSYNWTNKANVNHENIIVIQGMPSLASEFVGEFYNLTKSFKLLSATNATDKISTPNVGTIEAIMWWEKLPLEWKFVFADKIKCVWHKFTALDIDRVLYLSEIEITNVVPGRDEVLPFIDGVNNFKPLYALKNLKKLKISNNNLSNISFVNSMSLLEDVCFESNSLFDLVELGACEKLIRVCIVNKSKADLVFVSSLPFLSRLDVYTDGNIDIDLIADSDSLETLYVSGATISNFGEVAHMNKLRNLILHNVVFGDVSTTWKVKNVKTLSITNRNRKDGMNFIRLFVGIETLLLANTVDVNVLSLLSEFKFLKRVTIENIPINTAEFLLDSPQLEEVSLERTNITDISPLTKLSYLKKLWIWDAELSNILSSPNYVANIFRSSKASNEVNIKSELEAFKSIKPDCKLSHRLLS